MGHRGVGVAEVDDVDQELAELGKLLRSVEPSEEEARSSEKVSIAGSTSAGSARRDHSRPEAGFRLILRSRWARLVV